ncbi:MAG TPA: GNAT family N-acetyltransferase [Bacteroidetes bacterium]|nr:GNAT family N-acetyltransferase [Bacteroidota bacterium]
MKIIPVTRERFDDFIALVMMLAEYEHLDPPAPEAQSRLLEDICGAAPRIQAMLAVDDNDQALGYAITLETYSSFLALPTMYLEDIFVREDARGLGAGSMLFDAVVEQARRRGCGRVDWQVLDWNRLARDFYERRGAAPMKEWMLYRIDLTADPS